jgi:hypothetical protein
MGLSIIFSVIIGQIINIVLKGIKACMETQKMLKLMGIIFTICIILFCWLAVFIIVS